MRRSSIGPGRPPRGSRSCGRVAIVFRYRVYGMNHLVRADLTDDFYTSLRHLSVDLGKPMNKLMIDGLVLLLRFHERGHGLPEPEPPKPSSLAARAARKAGAR